MKVHIVIGVECFFFSFVSLLHRIESKCFDCDLLLVRCSRRCKGGLGDQNIFTLQIAVSSSFF
eukprot:m.124107 g.124107  ORF g.124107 m.124107 type:complete len:63 (-) comp15586_c1_seq1:226-414(-)